MWLQRKLKVRGGGAGVLTVAIIRLVTHLPVTMIPTTKVSL